MEINSVWVLLCLWRGKIIKLFSVSRVGKLLNFFPFNKCWNDCFPNNITSLLRNRYVRRIKMYPSVLCHFLERYKAIFPKEAICTIYAKTPLPLYTNLNRFESRHFYYSPYSQCGQLNHPEYKIFITHAERNSSAVPPHMKVIAEPILLSAWQAIAM